MHSEQAAGSTGKDGSVNVEKKRYGIRDLFYNLNGVFSVLMVSLNTFVVFPFLIVAIVFKLIPLGFSRKIATICLKYIAETWISFNTLMIDYTKNIKWNVTGLESLRTDKWYLVLSNHQSWSDIVILQKFLNRRIPMLRFFIKQELIWVPILGLAWWAFDYPFMKRYSKAEIARKPHLAGKDIEETKKACEKFKNLPVAVMNFVEGTRFTEEKKKKTESRYENLLNPRAGGTGFVLSSMGDYLTDILNITIKYGDDRRSFWDFLSGRVKEVTVIIENIPITDDLKGNFDNDKIYREHVINWINDLWSKKDRMLADLK